MLVYVIRRLLLLGPTLLGVLAVVFFVMAFAPGGFGGRVLTAEGAQTEGLDARRTRLRIERRYGLDLPLIAQFGRWLNQVSPIGFRMSSDILFSDAQRAEARAILEPLPLNTRPRNLERAVDVAVEIARYRIESPAASAQRLADALADPVNAMHLFDLMDVSLEPTIEANLRDKLRDLLQRDDGLARAQNALVEDLALEASGRSRVRFDKPAFKVPDLGRSLSGRRVSAVLLERLPVTVLLNALSLPIIYVVAIVSGLYAARRRGTLIDYGTGTLFVALWSIPTIWAGVMLLTYFANVQHFHWFPTLGLHDLQADRMPFMPRWGSNGFERGWLLDTLWHLVLPVACMSYGGFAIMSKVMRGSILDALSADYVRTARAKGVPERQVLWRHTFRNAMLPLITMVSGILPSLFAGTVIVETIFSIDGLGRLGVQAAFEKDRELLMATTLIAAMLGLTAELIRDLCYAIADPRVSYE